MFSFFSRFPRSSFVIAVFAFITLFLGIAIWMGSSPRVSAAEIPFGAEVLISSLDGAYSLSPGDIDGDGDLDMLGVATNSNTVAWWDNLSGDGILWSASHVLTNTLSGGVEVLPADLDKDGDLDVVAASSTNGDIWWWENANGIGTVWQASLVESFFAQTTGIFIADVNRDGALDIAAVGTVASTESVLWYENSGDGSLWTRRTVASGLTAPYAVVAADLDQDGDLDLIVSSQDENEISWWRNNDGVGLSWTKFTLSSNYLSANGIAVADMDGDGDPDVVAAYAEDNGISWRENDGNGQGWTDFELLGSLNDPVSVATADMDSDGDMDILGAGNLTDETRWWDNVNGDGSAWLEYPISFSFDGARTIRPADVNGDGLLDAIGAAENADKVVWWQNTSIHRNAEYPLSASIVVDGNMTGAFSVAGADFDQDGKMDMLSGAATTGEVAWYRNSLGNGTNWTKNAIGSLGGVRSVFVADLNRDGAPDVLAVGTSASDVVWWANNGNGTFGGSSFIDNDFPGAFWVGAGDVDGDGDLDVVGAAFGGGGYISWWENVNGFGSFGSENVIENGYDGATSVSTADLDGDGDLDVLGSSYFENDISWWENTTGTGSAWTLHTIDNAINGPVSTFPADVDGDGDLDVVGASNVAEEFSWWENTDGQGTFDTTQVVIGAGFANAEAVYVADLDNDGDLDVAGAAQNDNTVVWFENEDGTGQSWVEHILTNTLQEAVAVHVADVDQDGRPDILSAAAVENQVRWWGNRGGQFSLNTVDTSPLSILEGLTTDVMAITFAHNGRDLDSDIELTTLEFLFEETPGNVMGGPEANAIIEDFHLYLDDGSGVFEENLDFLVLTIPELDLFAGYTTIELPEAEPSVQLEAGQTKTFFIVLELTPDAGSQEPNYMLLTHLTSSSPQSSAEDVEAQIPLQMAFAPDVVSSLLTFAPDLFIEKYANTLPLATAPLGEGTVINPGDPITYTIVYSNTTNIDAIGFQITDQMPPEVVYSSYSFTGFTPTLTIDEDTYQFALGDLPPQATGSITILANLSSSVSNEYVFENTATLNGVILNSEIIASSSAGLEINIPPFVDAGLDQVVSLGQVYILTAYFSDPGAKDVHQASIDWGDGTVIPGVVNQTLGTVTASHAYLTEGKYQVSVTVIDSDGGSNSDFALFTVRSSTIYLPLIVKP